MQIPHETCRDKPLRVRNFLDDRAKALETPGVSYALSMIQLTKSGQGERYSSSNRKTPT